MVLTDLDERCGQRRAARVPKQAQEDQSQNRSSLRSATPVEMKVPGPAVSRPFPWKDLDSPGTARAMGPREGRWSVRTDIDATI
jgi:hypothetical protein